MLRRLTKKMLIICLMAVLLVPTLFAFGCNVDYRDDSEVYSCYYYAVNGEDLTSNIVYYKLELRTDSKLITRYKTKKNGYSGKDSYTVVQTVSGNFLCVEGMDGPDKYYDMVANEIVISEYLDSKTYVLAKFRLITTAKAYTKTVYSFTGTSGAQTDEVDNLKYYLIGFEENGEYYMFHRSDKSTITKGEYTKDEQGYTATAKMINGETVEPCEYYFKITEDGLEMETIEGENTITYQFELSPTPDLKGE